MRTKLLVGVLGWVASLVCASAQAAVSLSDLVNNSGSVIVGGSLLFDQFAFTTSGLMPNGDRINVDSYTDAFGNYGLRFHGGYADLPGDGDSILNISYRVSAVTPGQGLSGAYLAGNPAAVGNGSFVMTESFTGVPDSLTVSDVSPGSTNLLDFLALPSVMSSLNVALSLIGSSTSGGVTGSFVDTTFTQSADNVVPEPSSAVIWLGTLMICGVLPVVYRRWQNAPEMAAAKRGNNG